jgi:mannose-1-phosphate guanylyltransferase
MLDTMASNDKAEGVMVLTKVLEPSRYGVVVTDSTGQVKRFVEKP